MRDGGEIDVGEKNSRGTRRQLVSKVAEGFQVADGEIGRVTTEDGVTQGANESGEKSE